MHSYNIRLIKEGKSLEGRSEFLTNEEKKLLIRRFKKLNSKPNKRRKFKRCC